MSLVYQAFHPPLFKERITKLIVLGDEMETQSQSSRSRVVQPSSDRVGIWTQASVSEGQPEASPAYPMTDPYSKSFLGDTTSSHLQFFDMRRSQSSCRPWMGEQGR